MVAISNREIRDLQVVLTWVSQLRDCASTNKEANTIRKARLLLRSISKKTKTHE